MSAAAAAVRRSERAEEFGKNLKAAREAKGWTQGQLAIRSGIKLNMIRMYEQGRTWPSIERLATLCQLLDVTIDHLIPVRPDRGGKHQT